MRVTINRDETQKKEKTGIFSSRVVTSYRVVLTVDFSETELAIIRQHNLGTKLIYERHMPKLEEFYIKSNLPYNDSAIYYRISIDRLIKEKPIPIAFDTPIEANNFERELKDDLLPALKGYIEGNTTQGPKTETFEL